MPSRLTVVLMSLLLATPAVAFWLWLVIVTVRVAMLCPEECECYTAGYYISCSSTSLTDLPLIQFTDVRAISLYNSNITLLEKNGFVSMTELKFLHILSCELRTIELGAFNGLTKILYLSIQGNNISELLKGTFDNMSNLYHLDLSDNKIEHLDRDVFSGFRGFNGLTKLTWLSIQGNEISELIPGIFENMSNLEYLDLSYNRLEHLDSAVFRGLGAFNGLTKLTKLLMRFNEIRVILAGTFENMCSLEHLDLSLNNLVHLDSAVFSGLVKLKYVNLSLNRLQYLHPQTFSLDKGNCHINSLSVETFSKVSAMESLDLRHNNLKTVDINILRALPKLYALYLYGNLLLCDCQLQEVWRWCEDRNITTGYESWVPKCDTPNEVKSLWWGVLEKGLCLEGNIEYYGDYNSERYSETDIGDLQTFYKEEDNIEILQDYQLPAHAVPFIFGTTGNIILLIIIISNKDMRTVPNMYILNLALSDIIYVTVIFFEACANRIYNTWHHGDFKGTSLPFFRRLSIGLSAYCVALYSFQRYRVTVNPFQVRVSSQTKWSGIVCEIFGVWIVAALFAVPTVLTNILRSEVQNVGSMTYYQRVVIFELLVSCVFPLCVIAFSYIMTAHHLVASSRAMSEGTQNPVLRTRRNSAKIVLGLTVVFLISYVPYHVYWTYYFSCQEEFALHDSAYSSFELDYTYLISTCFLLFNSCLNPVALFCTSSQFRQHLKRYLTCFCKTSSPSTDFELERRS